MLQLKGYYDVSGYVICKVTDVGEKVIYKADSRNASGFASPLDALRLWCETTGEMISRAIGCTFAGAFFREAKKEQDNESECAKNTI